MPDAPMNVWLLRAVMAAMRRRLRNLVDHLRARVSGRALATTDAGSRRRNGQRTNIEAWLCGREGREVRTDLRGNRERGVHADGRDRTVRSTPIIPCNAAAIGSFVEQSASHACSPVAFDSAAPGTRSSPGDPGDRSDVTNHHPEVSDLSNLCRNFSVSHVSICSEEERRSECIDLRQREAGALSRHVP